MNKTFSTIFFAVLLSILVLATVRADLTMSLSDSTLTVFQDDNITVSLYITSTENTTVNLSIVGLPTGITTTLPNQVILNASEQKTVEFTIKANNNADLGEYTSTINADNLTGSESTSVTFDLTVKQNYCSEGLKGSKLRLTVDNPDNNDDFYVGENISIDVNVKNLYSHDIDFVIEAQLYDLTTGDEIDSADLDDSLNDGDNDDYSLYIKVPYDLDTGDDYVINVKTYEDGNEEEQCKQDSVPITLKKRSHSVIIDKVTFSNSLSCSMPLDLSVKVANAGKNDESNVEVRISSTSLNLSADLTKDIDKNDQETYTFSEVLPIVAPGKYTLKIEVIGEDSTDYQSIELNLQANCRTQKQDASLVILQQNTASINQDVIFKTTITNTGDKTTTYNINVLDYQSWATLSGISPTQVTLNAGESRDVIITLRPNQNASSSNYFKVQASFNNQLKTQEAVLTISSQNTPTTGSGTFENLRTAIKNNAWLFIINVILVVLIIGLIILVATKPRKPVVKKEEPKEARLKTKNSGKKK